MKFIERHIQATVLLVFITVMSVTAAVLWERPQSSLSQNVKPSLEKYVCPMHPDVTSAKPGNCPKCGMALKPVSAVKTADREDSGHRDGCCSKKDESAENHSCPHSANSASGTTRL